MRIVNSRKTILEGGIFSDLITKLMISGHAVLIKGDSDTSIMDYDCTVEGVQTYCDLNNIPFWTLWGQAQVLFEAANNPKLGIFHLGVYIYGTVDLLDKEVPDGLPDNTLNGVKKTFKEWYGTENISIDETKCITYPSSGASGLTMEHINILLTFCENEGYELCNLVRVRELLASEFSIDSEI